MYRMCLKMHHIFITAWLALFLIKLSTMSFIHALWEVDCPLATFGSSMCLRNYINFINNLRHAFSLQGMSLPGLFNVLSTRPVLNKVSKLYNCVVALLFIFQDCMDYCHYRTTIETAIKLASIHLASQAVSLLPVVCVPICIKSWVYCQAQGS